MAIQGIIRPPTEIRVVADRTAKFVSKNGRAFEQRILSSEKGKTPKFAFLTETSPFHAYYEDRIRFYEEGGVDEDVDEGKKTAINEKEKENEEKEGAESNKKEEEKNAVVVVETKQMKASAIDPVGRALLSERANIKTYVGKRQEEEKAEGKNKTDNCATTPALIDNNNSDPPAPPALALASIASPSTATSSDLEIIKLVAQFTAVNHHLSIQQQQHYNSTSNFFQEISRLEWNNPTFGFLQPRHAHFAYFTALVDAYRRLLSIVDDLNGAIPSVNRLMEPSYTSILLNSISSPDNNNAFNVEQQCLQMAAYRVEYDRYEKEKKHQLNQENGENNDNVNNPNITTPQSAYINWHDFVVVETIDFPMDEIVVAVDPTTVDRAIAIQPPPPPPPPPLPLEQQQTNEDDMDMSDSDSDNGSNKEYIKIDTSYQPRVVHANTNTNTRIETVIDPISNKSIPIQNMEEHMRIQLLDPKWAQERQRFLEKQSESNLVKGTDIARNITSFVGKKRDDGDDMFGTFTSEEERLKFDHDNKKRLEDANRIIRQVPPPPPPLPSTLPMKRTLDMQQQQQQYQSSYLSTVVASGAPSQQPPPPPPPPPTLEQQPLSKKTCYNTTTYDIATNNTTAIPLPPPPPPLPEQLTLQPPLPEQLTEEPIEKELLPEAEFLALLPSPNITLILNLPPTTTTFNFLNQSKLTLSDFNVATTTIKQLKQLISQEFSDGNIPSNKLQIKFQNMFLKDGITLASVNCYGGDEYALDVIPKVRGGRK